jgi:hypothetical protein
MTSLITNILNAHNKNNIYDNYNNSIKNSNSIYEYINNFYKDNKKIEKDMKTYKKYLSLVDIESTDYNTRHKEMLIKKIFLIIFATIMFILIFL